MTETKKKMTKKQSTPIEGAVSTADAVQFAMIADEVMRAPTQTPTQKHALSKDNHPTPHIGTLREKRLHAAIKIYLCPDMTCHEQPIADLLRDNESTSGTKSRRMVADILTDGEITEVQTGGFFPLRDKVRWYLTHTACRVTVVHPIAAVRYLSWIDPADGSILSRRRSPKRGRVRDVTKELFWLSEFIPNPRFSVRLLLLELEEYRMADGWSRDGKRGSSRYERFPTALLGDVTLATATDYAAYFLPPSLNACNKNGTPIPFTAAEYAKASGIRGKATYSMLKILTALGLIRETEEKLGRSQGYVVVL